MSRVKDVVKQLEERNRREAENPTPVAAASELAIAVSANRRELFAEAERIINARLDQIPQDRWPGALRPYFTSEEISVFDTLNLSNDDLAKEFGRLLSVRRWQGEAGTSADRAAAGEQLQTAAEALATEGPALEEHIARLNQQLHSLKRANNTAAAKVEQQAAAVEQLRKLVPQHVAHDYERLQAGIRPKQALLSNCESRLASLRGQQQIDVSAIDGKRQARLCAASSCPEAMRDAQDPAEPFLAVAVWQAYVATLTAEIDELEASRAELTQALTDAEATLRSARDFYAR